MIIKYLLLFLFADQAEQCVKYETSGLKYDGLDRSEAPNGYFHGISQLPETKSSLSSLHFSHKEPVLTNQTEEIINKPLQTSSSDTSAFEQVIITSNDFQPDVENTGFGIDAIDFVNSNLNELLLDLSESLIIPEVMTTVEKSSNALVSEIPTLLDQSFTEDVVNQPLLSGMITNGAFNPSQPDSLTEDELLNYLAELENEKDETNNQHSTAGSKSSEHIEYCQAQASNNQEEFHPEPASNLLDIVESISVNLSNTDSHHNVTLTEDLSQFSTIIEAGEVESAGLVSEESGESDTDTSETQPENESTSGDDEMPQLIDDPSIIVVAEPKPSLHQASEETVATDHQLETTPAIAEEVPEEPTIEESNQEDVIIEHATETEVIEETLTENTETAALENASATADIAEPVDEPEQSHQENLEPYSSLTEDEQLLGVLKPVYIFI